MGWPQCLQGLPGEEDGARQVDRAQPGEQIEQFPCAGEEGRESSMSMAGRGRAGGLGMRAL